MANLKKRSRHDIENAVMRAKAKHWYLKTGSKKKVAEKIGVSLWTASKFLQGVAEPPLHRQSTWEWPSFVTARRIVRREAKSQGITTGKKYVNAREWRAKHRLPSEPQRFYREWISWEDWFGHKAKLEWPSFTAGRRIVRREAKSQGITSAKKYWDARDWRAKYRLPTDPHTFYKEWVSWEDWLGKSRAKLETAAREWYTKLGSTLKVAKKLGIPQATIHGWVKDLVAKKWASFKQARTILKKKKFKSRAEYVKASKWRMENRLPSHASEAYEKDWRGWEHFLGKS